MKLKKRAILYMEGMLDRNEEEEFIKRVKKRPDIIDFMQSYRWIENGLKVYFLKKINSQDNGDRDVDEMAREDIQKYLKDYTPTHIERENRFIQKLKDASEGNLNDLKRDRYSLILSVAASLLFIAVLFAAGVQISRLSEEKQAGFQFYNAYFLPHQDFFLLTIDSDYVTFNGSKFTFNPDDLLTNNKKFKTILRDGNTSQEDILLISIALMQDKEHSMAQSYLQGLLEISESSFEYPARWYLALLQLREGKEADAMRDLRILCKSNNLYTSRSCKLLRTLEEKEY